MIFQLIRLEVLKTMRSTSFARSLLVGIFLVFIALLLLGYVLVLGVVLKEIITDFLKKPQATDYLNSVLIYFFLFEFMYRYFIQKLPVLDLGSLLHLPIKKSHLIHFLLIRSFISPLSLMALLLFAPFAFREVAVVFGTTSAWTWLLSILLTSWTLHWVMLWFKQKFEDSFIGLIVVFAVLLLGAGSNYFGWYNLGEIMKPVFDLALSSSLPVLVLFGLFCITYFLAYKYYRQNAYLEDLVQEEVASGGFAQQSFGFLSRFGLAGEMATVEWKLILRHKKSRTYLMLSAFFLLYGLIFYSNPVYQTSDGGISAIFIFVGAFITGIFMLQYGQLFLSWNSANFDFFLSKKAGAEALVKGKYLLFIAISCLCFLLSVPYVYFGWQFLLIHLATFLFNIGVIIHLVIYLALWKPKPMDLNKGAMFNYEGVGIAQFLMIIPMMVAPYAVYLPFAYFVSDYAGLAALAITGIIGILAFPVLSRIAIQKVLKNRYQISASFRQEL
ncbi:DUF5687 family protein [Pararhodonellum marinum]|uniref:DUF5687 family protein n=1 Tax=Pararhodonellum marinum TaxID=2755358 RepID=UPI00188F30D5|nr:DUF5687 family protein [Pararhodonellum marinum]